MQFHSFMRIVFNPQHCSSPETILSAILMQKPLRLSRLPVLVVLLLCGYLLFHAGALQAQHTKIEIGADALFLTAQDLMEKKKYAAAREAFERLQEMEPDTERAIHAAYYVVACAYHLQHPDFESLALRFTERYPTHPMSILAYTDLGLFYFDKGDYKKTIENLEKNSARSLRNEKDLEASYKLAYAYFTQKNYRRAGTLFNRIKGGNHQYASYASYYAAYIDYEQQNYENALKDLEKARRNRQLEMNANIMMVSIYYKLGRCQEVNDFIGTLQSSGASIPEEIYLAGGDCFFQARDYSRAASFLGEYVKMQRRKVPNSIFYRLGYSQLQIEQLNPAITHLSNAADGQDSIAQRAAYHLGIAYVQSQQKSLALTAFDKGRRLEHDRTVRELSTYHFVQVAYDVADFQAVIDGAEFYVSNFPNGPNLQRINNMSSQAYRYTGNYEKAFEFLKRQLPLRDRPMQEAWQEVTFNRAVQLYNGGNNRFAIQMLRSSLEQPRNSGLVSRTYFWLGEIYSAEQKYDSAIIHYREVRRGVPEYGPSLYGIAYAHYNTKNYKSALDFFEQFLREAQNDERRIDALIRLADCYYVTKDYQRAIFNYERALSNASSQADYINYQLGLTHMANRSWDTAIRYFDLVINMAASQYADDALYQKGMVFFENGRFEDAARTFNLLVTNHRTSIFLPFAYSRLGIAYTNMRQWARAVESYKRVIDLDPTNKYAESAIGSMQEIDRDFRVADLDAYIQKFQRANPTSQAVVRANFDNASRPFNDGQFTQAIQSLTRFLATCPPQSQFAHEANYLLGMSYAQLGRKEEAMESFRLVQGEPRERALREMGILNQEMGRHGDAAENFTELLGLANNRRSLETALVGLMETYFELQSFEAVVQYANRIKQENITRRILRADLYLAKVKMERQDFNSAMDDMIRIQRSTDDVNGAEAFYLMGVMLRRMKQLDESTAHLEQMRSNKFSSHPDWVFRAFIIIAENYIDQGRTVAARSALTSVMENSRNTHPAISEQARVRLQSIN